MNPTGPGAVDIAPGVRLPDAALRWSFVASGGPGGQNVNKVATKAVLRIALDDLRATMPAWSVDRLIHLAGARATATDLILTASADRSQLANRRAALHALRRLVIESMHRPTPRRPTRPSRAAIRRRLDAKTHRGRIKLTRRRPDEHP